MKLEMKMKGAERGVLTFSTIGAPPTKRPYPLIDAPGFFTTQLSRWVKPELHAHVRIFLARAVQEVRRPPDDPQLIIVEIHCASPEVHRAKGVALVLRAQGADLQ